MNPEVKAKWLAALRSGEYKQAKHALRRDEGFCCLGVLCDLHAKDTGDDWTHGINWLYDGQSGSLPEKVYKWAGIGVPAPERLVRPLVILNDGSSPFSEIADHIEVFL